MTTSITLCAAASPDIVVAPAGRNKAGVVSGTTTKKKTAASLVVVGPRTTRAKPRRSVVVVVASANVSSPGETNDDDVDENSETALSSSETTAIALAGTIEREGDSETEYELVGPKPERFKVAEGQLAGLLTAATPASTRLISGVLTQGWKASLEKGPAPDGEYTFGSFGGRYLKETSDTESFKRPEKPLKLYEFEGCPFCRKVREAIVWLDLWEG